MTDDTKQEAEAKPRAKRASAKRAPSRSPASKGKTPAKGTAATKAKAPNEEAVSTKAAPDTGEGPAAAKEQRTKAGSKTRARKPAAKPAEPDGGPQAEAGDGLRDDDRTRLRELLAKRRKAEGGSRKATPPRAKPAPRALAPEKASLPVQTEEPDAVEQRETVRTGWKARLGRWHEAWTEHRGRGPERIPTGPPVRVAELASDAHNATPRWLINAALDALPDGPEDFTLVDIGAGRGRVVLEAARRPFEHIIGVEKDAGRYEDAMTNLRHWPRSLMACRDVDFVHADALKWQLPRKDLVLFIFREFGDRSMLTFAQRVNRRVAEGHRVRIVYIDPKTSLPFRESGYFRHVEIEPRLRRKIDLLGRVDVQLFENRDGVSVHARTPRRKRRRSAAAQSK